MKKDVIHAPENIPAHIQTFKDIDFLEDTVWNSSLLKPLLQGHYIMLENSGNPLPKVFEMMNVSTDVVFNK